MRKTMIIVLACVMLFGAIGVGIASAARPWEESAMTAAPSLKPTVGDIIPGPTIPQLTNEEKAMARRIALADPQIKEVLKGKQFTVKKVVPCLADGKKIGAFVTLSLQEPSFIEHDWPVAIYDAQGSYKKSTHHQGLVVDRLDIQVDLKAGQALSMIPVNAHHRGAEPSALESLREGEG